MSIPRNLSIIADTLNLDGTFASISNTGSTTLSSGTANGVAYLNNSKVLTTGSALTFDGTNLGVGISSPSFKLDVRGTSGTGISFIETSSGNSARIQLGTASGLGTINSDAGSGSIATAFQISGTEQMRLTSTGLGIGTSSPGVKLDVAGAIRSYISGGTPIIYFGNGTTQHSISNASGAMPFAIDGVEKMRIDSSGNLLVGATSTSASSGSGIKSLPANNGANNPQLAIVTSASTNSTASLSLYSTGASNYRFYVTDGGSIYATSSVITAISDQRLKENVRDIDTGLNAIMALKPRRFDWKEGKGQDKKDVAGFIAQEFEDVFPECVGTTKAGGDGIEYKNINHETLIPTLVKAIQEQQALITSLTARITALESKEIS